MRYGNRTYGFLARRRDGQPGVTVIWRGWQRLNDIANTWLIYNPPNTCGLTLDFCSLTTE